MRLAVLTTGRQDWGHLRPLCEALAADPAFELKIIAGGMACSPAFGRIVDAVRDEGFPLAAELEWSPETADAVDQSSVALAEVGRALQVLQPDTLVLLGDRYETAAAALAATLLRVPIVHLHGGEETTGAIDNVLRHAITKLSHLHLVAHQAYAERVIQMGEDPATVHVVGALAVDNVLRRALPTREDLEHDLGISLEPPVGLVTVHPTTLGPDGSGEVEAVIDAVQAYPATWIVTLPNADPGHEHIREAFQALAAAPAALAAPDRPPAGPAANTAARAAQAPAPGKILLVPALGEERYLGLMKLAAFVLGNSSSGLVEAPSMRVPTVNVGDRQQGRIRSLSVIDVPPDTDAILAALHKAESQEFRAAVAWQPLPFGSGDAATRIVAILRQWRPPVPPRKAFYSMDLGTCAT
jgi:UDP-N-acetylglucosamine 2-epimerase (non-hydrolysing)